VLSRRMDAKRPMGSRTVPGDSTCNPSTSLRIPTSRSVANKVARSGVASSLTFWRTGLGLRLGTTLAAIWKACSIFSRSQVIFIGWLHGC